MQALFDLPPYAHLMAGAASRLKKIRQAAGLTMRELARQIGEDHSNIRYWETTGKIPRSDVLAPMAKVLGVTVEELLGQPKPSRVSGPGGRARQLFEAVSRMPRRQQDKVLDILEPFVRQQVGGKAA
jgi:transcriptional regulator with XRE-family HTH domain